MRIGVVGRRPRPGARGFDWATLRIGRAFGPVDEPAQTWR